jgi:hypothetical protein
MENEYLYHIDDRFLGVFGEPQERARFIIDMIEEERKDNYVGPFREFWASLSRRHRYLVRKVADN